MPPTIRRPENLAKPAKREIVAVKLKQLGLANEALDRAVQERRDRRFEVMKLLEAHRGDALLLKGDIAVIRFKGEDPPLPAGPIKGGLLPDYYTVAMLGSHRPSTEAKSIPVVWLNPVENRDIAAYASPIDTLQVASLAEMKATHASREAAE